MKPFKLALCLCVLMVTPVMTAQRPPDPKVEIYIPAGMEKIIQIEATRDESEPTITKYNIKRIVGPEVNKVTILNLIVGPEGKIDHEFRYTTSRVSDPANVAWASMIKADRLILIVERVETKDGEWVLDADDVMADPKAVVERGKDALPHARFVKRE